MSKQGVLQRQAEECAFPAVPEDCQQSFVMYDNWMAQLFRLDLSQRGTLLTNIFARRAGRELLEMDAVTDMLFSIICDQLDRDAAKWVLKRQKRRAAGAAGGRASGKAREAKRTDASKDEAKEAVNGTVNATVNGTVNATVTANGSGTVAALKNPAAAAVLREYSDRVNPTPSRLCIDELAEFAQTLGAEVCIHAIQVALDEKKTQWSYIRAILRGYQNDGVRCLADIQAREERRQRAKKEPPDRNSQFQKHGGPLSERAKRAVQQALEEA